MLLDEFYIIFAVKGDHDRRQMLDQQRRANPENAAKNAALEAGHPYVH